jgi:hypothetical protein
MMKGLRAAVAAWAALGATAAMAAQDGAAKAPPCVTKAEADAILTLIAPGAIRGLAKACAPSLPATAYMKQRGDALAQRFVALSATARPQAIAAAVRLGGDKAKEMTEGPMLDLFVGTMVEAAISEAKLTAQDCTAADGIVALLDPLPPANLTGLLVELAEIGLRHDKGKVPFRICPAPPRG